MNARTATTVILRRGDLTVDDLQDSALEPKASTHEIALEAAIRTAIGILGESWHPECAAAESVLRNAIGEAL